MQCFTLLHPSELFRSNFPAKVFPGESPPCESFFSIYFLRKLTTGTSSLLINLIVYVIIITRKIRKGINENILPNVESYFECCRT